MTPAAPMIPTGGVSAVTFAQAIREALTAQEGNATPVEVVLDPLTGKPAGAFALNCAAGRFVVSVAERK